MSAPDTPGVVSYVIKGTSMTEAKGFFVVGCPCGGENCPGLLVGVDVNGAAIGGQVNPDQARALARELLSKADAVDLAVKARKGSH